VQSTLKNLVTGLVDYAGLFPPAGLPMRDVVANFARYQMSPQQAMLGRLVVPVSRLDELESEVARLTEEREVASKEVASKEVASEEVTDELAIEPSTWRISALLPTVDIDNDREIVKAIAEVQAFNQRMRPTAIPQLKIDSWEMKTPQLEQLDAALRLIPADTRVFLEIDSRAALHHSLARIAESGRGNAFAKIRTGSVVASEIPSVEDVARFVEACARHAVGFKATAGLHHPWRGEYRLTYETDSPCGEMHGFVNVAVAAMLAFEFGLKSTAIEGVLRETQREAFVFEDGQLRWREFSISEQRIVHWRERGFLSFGSCSFDEPVNEI
jgi:hypothetical protein